MRRTGVEVLVELILPNGVTNYYRIDSIHLILVRAGFLPKMEDLGDPLRVIDVPVTKI